ncbi:hypothetical protein BJ878DRAFT_396276, partial [Calycina marina]
LHNWPDANVVKVMKHLVSALRPVARILVHDLVLPDPGKLPLLQERRIRAMDTAMRSLCNFRERDEADWRQILKKAHSRFQVLRVFTTKGSALGIVDVTWTEE